MKILIVSDTETRGGAAIAASRLADGLCLCGESVSRAVFIRDGEEHLWQTYDLAPPDSLPLASRVWRKVHSAKWKRGSAERAVVRAFESLIDQLRPDLINLHNIHGAGQAGWSVDLARAAYSKAPVVWTLHDMWSFTGRCAYSYDCRRFVSGCDGNCPTPEEYPALDAQLIAPAWERRRKLLDDCPRMAAVAPSSWMADEARQGIWSGHRVEVIPYGLPLDTYKPIDQAVARKALGLEAHGPVLLAAAEYLTQRRKGGHLLLDALKRLNVRPITLVTMGHGRLDMEGIPVHHLGYVDHDRMKALAYSAADIFVHPAPVDNLPLVVMESIACGTPVAAFATGGVPDMVRPGLTGWLAKETAPEALAGVLELALDEISNSRLRRSCRETAETEYGAALQAARYLKLFDSIRERSEIPEAEKAGQAERSSRAVA